MNEKLEKAAEKLDPFDWLRSQNLPDHVAFDSKEQRVDVEAIDFDWIFIGSEKNNTSNAKNLLILLNNQEDGELFVQKGVKIFIDLVWEKYQEAIVKKIFVWYLVYLALFVYLASNVAGTYMNQIEAGRIKDPTKRFYDWVPLGFCYGITFLCMIAIYEFSFKLEITQFIAQPTGYLQDAWNWVDLVSFVLNFGFLICLNINVVSGQIIVPIDFIRVIGGCCCFCMWIKVFYWCRLFSNTAYFINLIIQTLNDSKYFAVMLLIIITSFTQLFFIIQLNINEKDHEKYHYVVDYTGETVSSAWISMYVLAMGDFHFSGYGEGPDVFIAWGAWLLATYLMLLVFLNVLIAIMGDTFGRVSQL